jgi:membrane protease YdiL (CAAX protease family)
VCGRSPARVLTIRRHVGLVVVMRFFRIKAPFCRDHGITIANEYLRRTLVEGWWGFLSFFVNWVVVFSDWRALRRARKLPFPAGDAEPIAFELPDGIAGVLAESDEHRRERRSVMRTVVVSIGFGVAVLVTTLLTNDPSSSVARRFTIGSALTVLLYAVVSLLVGGRLGGREIRPQLSVGRGWRAIGIGAAVGVGAGALVGGFVSLVSGELTSDPSMIAVISEKQWTAVLVVLFIGVVAAPLIEEVLFRGLLVESFRARGRMSAVLAGAVAFSFWHLNPAALRYYVLMGFLLGYLYWRLGLAGSISAHAAFNGVLIALAFASLVGGPRTISEDGIVMDVPRGWTRVDTAEATGDISGDQPFAESVEIAVESPAGAAVLVERLDPADLTMQRFGPIAQVMRPPAGATSTRRVSVDGAPAVRFRLALNDGTPSDVVIVRKGEGVFILTFVAAGSDEAPRQFGTMLASLKLPAL